MLLPVPDSEFTPLSPLLNAMAPGSFIGLQRYLSNPSPESYSEPRGPAYLENLVRSVTSAYNSF